MIIFVFLDEKSPERETFSDAEEVKQKTAEPRKGINIDEFQTALSGGKHVSVGVLHHMEGPLKVTEA